jgi:signal transduction histidine kinase/ActR/RegA family two-component response regulator
MANSASAAVALHADAFRNDVKAELIRHLYRQAPGSIVTLFVVAAILAYVLWGIFPQPLILGWLAAVAAVSVVRFVQIGAYFRRKPPDSEIGRWGLISAAGSALVGAVWTAACVLFLDPSQPISLIALTVILMGIAAGAVINLSSYLPSFWAVVGPSMGALIAVLLWHGGSISNTVAVLAAVASAGYAVGARNVHRLLTGSLELSFENLGLRREAEQHVADLRRREAALEAARFAAEQANAAKTRFLAAASHDLRQPIHALGLLFATLADRVRDEATAPVLKQIDGAVDAIDSMLNSLLDISKLDAGVVRPEIGPVNLGALLERLDSDHQPVAVVTSNRLRVRPTDAVVQSDATMLQRILANLVSNALRYTAHGRVLVGARKRGGSIRIEVYDTGPGIPSDALQDIFLEFHQLGNPERDRRKGLGLGLAIVRRLADLLGHRIEVRSNVGRGSRFSVVLPLSAAPQRAAAHGAAAPAAGADLVGRRVLVLDDDASVLEAMRSLLERWGCDVVTTTTPEEAEAALGSDGRPLDMLVIDYRLRRHASGIETIGRLHQVAGHRVPALVITGDTAPDRLREAQDSGYPLLHKPVKPAELRTVMRQLILQSPPARRT